MSRQHCSDHCTTCGQHFSSTAAFDAHREGSYEPDERYCVRDARHAAVPLVAVAGSCRITRPPEVERDVPIWGLV